MQKIKTNKTPKSYTYPRKHRFSGSGDCNMPMSMTKGFRTKSSTENGNYRSRIK